MLSGSRLGRPLPIPTTPSDCCDRYDRYDRYSTVTWIETPPSAAGAGRAQASGAPVFCFLFYPALPLCLTLPGVHSPRHQFSTAQPVHEPVFTAAPGSRRLWQQKQVLFLFSGAPAPWGSNTTGLGPLTETSILYRLGWMYDRQGGLTAQQARH